MGDGRPVTRHITKPPTIFDVDYHASDTRWELFLARCKVFYTEISKLAEQLDAVWFVEGRRNNIQGVRFILLLKKEHWIPKIRDAAQEFLGYLDKRYPKLAEIESFEHIEVFPVHRKKNCQGMGCRLPLGVDITRDGILGRVTITNEFLTHDPKTNLRRFVEWVDQSGANVPLEDFMSFMIKNTPKHEGPTEEPIKKKKTKTRSNPGCMGALPYKLKGNLKRLLRDFKLGNILPDTIGKYIAVVARLLHFWGADAEQVIQACIDRWRAQGIDTSFSDRVSGDENELWRVFAYLKEAIEQGNGYQAEPDQSTKIFQEVVACWRKKGFDPAAYLLADDVELPATGLDVADVEFRFDYAQRLLLKEHLHSILRGRGELEVEHTYECAERVIKFVLKYPERELACVGLMPLLCSDLPIKWHRNKCYAVMRCLVGLGFIKAVSEYSGGRSWLWRGENKELNKARRFEVGEALVGVSVPPYVSILSHSRYCWDSKEREEVSYGRLFAGTGFLRHGVLSG